MTDRGAPGIAGLAFLGWNCANKAYAWSLDGAAIIGHEIGHNWSANHCVDPPQAPWVFDFECGGGGMWIGARNQASMLASRDANASCLESIGPATIPLPPYAKIDHVTISKTQLDRQKTLTISPLENDHDANCDPISIGHFDRLTTQGGTVCQSGSELIYRPPVNFSGKDTFLYYPNDPSGLEGLGLVIVDVWAPQMEAYWPLNESAGTVAIDATGNGHNGTLINRDFGTDLVAGPYGTALAFNADDQYIALDNSPLSSPWTVGLWVNRSDSPNGSARIMAGSNGIIKLEQYNNTNNVGITIPSVNDWAFNYSAPVDTWTHLAFLGTTDAISLFVNGSFEQSLNVPIAAPLNTLGGAGTEAMRGDVNRSPISDYTFLKPHPFGTAGK